MSPPPQSLNSSSINPANLLEIQVLTQVIADLQSKNDIKGSIPYLAKIVQIIDNQKLVKPSRDEPKDAYYKQFNQLRKVKADAYSQLADAYFHTQQFIICENTLLVSVKIWEKLVQHTNEDCTLQLKKGYEQLKTCYEDMGKLQLAQHIENKLDRLEAV